MDTTVGTLHCKGSAERVGEREKEGRERAMMTIRCRKNPPKKNTY